MKKIIATTMAAGLVAAVASAEVSTTFDFASAYVFRGVTLSDGPSFQPGIEATGLGMKEECGSVTVGAWGAADLDNSYTGASSSTFQETDWYASYSLPIEVVDVSIGYCEYSYGAGISDKEMSISLGYDLSGVGISATYYQGVGGLIGTQVYGELGAGYDIEASEDLVVSLGARVGYLDPASGKSGFSDYDLSVGVSYTLSEIWSIGASVAYIGQIDDEVLGDETLSSDPVDGSVGYDVDVVGMLSLAASF